MQKLAQQVCVRTAMIFLALGIVCRPGAAQSPAPTSEEAKKFIEHAEQDLFALQVKAARADWVQKNFITDDTEAIAADADEIVNTAATRYAKEAHRFDQLSLPPELGRKRLLLVLARGFPAPRDPKAQKELAQILASLDGDYGKGKW